jgi:hypothetical protein
MDCLTAQPGVNEQVAAFFQDSGTLIQELQDFKMMNGIERQNAIQGGLLERQIFCLGFDRLKGLDPVPLQIGVRLLQHVDSPRCSNSFKSYRPSPHPTSAA